MNIRLFFICCSVFAGFHLAAQQKFTHTTSTANISANSTYLDNAGLNNNPSAIIIIEYNATTSTANPHEVGVWYDGNKWAVFNQDRAAMPTGITFTITWKNKDENSFWQKENSGKIILQHPLLNNNPAALFYVSQVWNPGGNGGVYNNSAVVTTYNNTTGEWEILNANNTVLPAGSAVNVLITPASQVGIVKNKIPEVKISSLHRRDSVRFRVTINGFTCNNPTADHILEVDGKGDEIFAGAVTQYFSIETGQKTSPAIRKWSLRYGDINSNDGRWGLRVKAGSKPGNMGGVQKGDQFPFPEPWKRNSPVDASTFPLLVSEGVLIDGENSAMVIPSVWEFDGTTEEEQQLNNFASTLGETAIFFGTNATATVLLGPLAIPFVTAANMTAHMAARFPANGQPVENLPMFAQLSYGQPEFNVIVRKTLFGDAKDRPIGMIDSGDCFHYTPIGMLLDYKSAIAITNSDFGYGKGIVPLRFRDAKAMEGDYTIYIQVDTINAKKQFNNPDAVMPYSFGNANPYKLQNVYSNASLKISFGGLPVAEMNADNYNWSFEKASSLQGIYYIRDNRSGKYLTITPSAAAKDRNGFEVFTAEKRPTENFKWRVLSNSDGTYSIINLFAGKAMIHDGPTGKILIWENRTNPEQRWKIFQQK